MGTLLICVGHFFLHIIDILFTLEGNSDGKLPYRNEGNAGFWVIW